MFGHWICGSSYTTLFTCEQAEMAKVPLSNPSGSGHPCFRRQPNRLTRSGGRRRFRQVAPSVPPLLICWRHPMTSASRQRGTASTSWLWREQRKLRSRAPSDWPRCPPAAACCQRRRQKITWTWEDVARTSQRQPALCGILHALGPYLCHCSQRRLGRHESPRSGTTEPVTSCAMNWPPSSALWIVWWRERPSSSFRIGPLVSACIFSRDAHPAQKSPVDSMIAARHAGIMTYCLSSRTRAFAAKWQSPVAQVAVVQTSTASSSTKNETAQPSARHDGPAWNAQILEKHLAVSIWRRADRMIPQCTGLLPCEDDLLAWEHRLGRQRARGTACSLLWGSRFAAATPAGKRSSGARHHPFRSRVPCRSGVALSPVAASVSVVVSATQNAVTDGVVPCGIDEFVFVVGEEYWVGVGIWGAVCWSCIGEGGNTFRQPVRRCRGSTWAAKPRCAPQHINRKFFAPAAGPSKKNVAGSLPTWRHQELESRPLVGDFHGGGKWRLARRPAIGHASLPER